MTPTIFDAQAFLRSLADDRELAMELLAAFMEDSPVRHAELGAAIAAGDADTASKRAHSLKGMCGVVRAQELINLALSMENSAREGDLGKTRETYAAFTELLAGAKAEIEQFMQQ